MPSILAATDNSAFAKQLVIWGLCLFTLTIGIGVAFWAAIQYHDSKFLVMILLFQVLASLVVGALAATIHSCLNSRIMDSETGSSISSPAGSVFPSSADEPRPPRNETARNFSLPRERCLDPPAPVTTRPLPVPPPYLATGIESITSAHLMPTSPDSEYDAQMPPGHSPVINEFVVQPLRIRKVNSLDISAALENATVSQPAIIKLMEKSPDRITFFPPLQVDKSEQSMGDVLSTSQDDHYTAAELSEEHVNLVIEESSIETATPPASIQPATSSTETQAAGSDTPQVTPSKTPTTSMAAFPSSSEDDQRDAAESPEEAVSMILEDPAFETTSYQTPQHSNTSTFEVQVPTRTTHVMPASPTVSPTKAATIRLVDSFLEVPQKTSHESLIEKWKEQPSFLDL